MLAPVSSSFPTITRLYSEFSSNALKSILSPLCIPVFTEVSEPFSRSSASAFSSPLDQDTSILFESGTALISQRKLLSSLSESFSVLLSASVSVAESFIVSGDAGSEVNSDTTSDDACSGTSDGPEVVEAAGTAVGVDVGTDVGVGVGLAIISIRIPSTLFEMYRFCTFKLPIQVPTDFSFTDFEKQSL